ncbi:MAG: twin-arginine translocase TatA/TatE family subunit [Chloroflexi bacterium]|nr:twin-arginine translocase TatA/TatE family subunit [Chloroflexota bacterium]MDA1270611.1 twin-arginine translocase TatA/TatE family subunit [Chloroflexota bacterium]
MNFMGMGIPELGVILLVAFLVLGPGKSIEMARNVGKVLGDLRRQFNDVTSAVSLEAMEQKNLARPGSQPSSEAAPGVPVRAELPPENEDGKVDGGADGPATAGPAEGESDDGGGVSSKG